MADLILLLRLKGQKLPKRKHLAMNLDRKHLTLPNQSGPILLSLVSSGLVKYPIKYLAHQYIDLAR